MKRYIGGTGLGTKFLYEEVSPMVEWNSPENRLIMASGPLGGTRVSGTGTFSAVTKSPQTNLAAASQANGFLGAFMKLSGFDGIIIQGKAANWSYLYVHDGEAELRDATRLLGKYTWETEDLIKKELSYEPKRMSVFGIGPAGESLVRFAVIVGDRGHIVSKGGMGAVLGSKRLKAVAVARGQNKVPVMDDVALAKAAEQLITEAMKFGGGWIHKWGTAAALVPYIAYGLVPVKNYTTNVYSEEIAEKLSSEYMCTHFEHKLKPCWACRSNHLRWVKVTEGPYKGVEWEEPEYECVAAWGPQTGHTDPGAIVMLTGLVDGLGLDVNESGWLIGWVMECYEKGLLKKEDLDDVEMRWGDPEATRAMLLKIAHREGIGNLLAEGVKRAAERLGGEAVEIGVYTLRGVTPRGHDHRSRWIEMLETCVSGTSTVETQEGFPMIQLLGKGKLENPFSPDEVSTHNAKYNGWKQFEESLGICTFCVFDQSKHLLDAFNAITGWGFTLDHAIMVGRRIVNQLRVFNLRHGLDPSLEAPSPRYRSTPTNGPHKGIGIGEHWDFMVRNYRRHMGWDEEKGRPLPETLRKIGLEELITDLWDSNHNHATRN